MGGIVASQIEVRAYDFQRPHQLSSLQLDGIALMSESFMRLASNFLATYLRTPVSMSLVGIDQVVYDQYVDHVKSPSVLVVYGDEGTEVSGNSVLQFDIGTALAIIDCGLGGNGSGEFGERELTEIEQTIFRRVMVQLLDLYAQTWRSLVKLQPVVRAVEFNPAFAQIASEGDLVVVERQQIQMVGRKDQLLWVWPFSAIQPLAVSVTRHGWGRGDDDAQPVLRSAEMQRYVEEVSVEASVILGRTRLTLREFGDLKLEDVIVLPTRPGRPLPLAVAGQDKLEVVLGRRGSNLAVRVVGNRGGNERDHV